MTRSIRYLPLIATCTLTASVLAACSASPPPAASGNADAQATELRDTIQKPINKAKGVEDIIAKSHDKQDSQLQDAEGGNASPASQ